MRLLATLLMLVPIIISPYRIEAAGKPLELSLSPSTQTVVEGQWATLVLNKSGGNGRPKAAAITVSDGSFTASIIPGNSFTVPTADNKVVDGPRDLIITATATTGAKASATVHVLDNDVDVPPPPPPTTTPGDVPAPSLAGEATIADNFNPANGIGPTEYGPNGSGGIPGQSPDDVGAFRMFCSAGAVLKDDPIVYPGQPGKSHLHQFIGNTGTNANSTYTSLRTTGGTTCGNYGSQSTPINRSAYWIPAMMDGVGNVVKPDFNDIYYKRVPTNSPACTDPVKRRGICADLPNGLRYIFGWNAATHTNSPSDPNTWEYWFFAFECWGSEDGLIGNGTAKGRYHTIKEVADAGCPVGAQLVITGFAEDCWDGVHIDTPDHRSHMSYATGEDKGYGRVCDAAHPYLIPDLQFQWHYTVDANLATWHLSSDEMVQGAASGSTMHMDYWEAWSPTVKNTWQRNCIDGHLSCASGDLGNGTEIKGAGNRDFDKHVLVPVP